MKSVKISKDHIKTKYEKDDFEMFKNELFFYLLGKQKRLNYIPKLVSYDCDKLIICTENVGTTLEEYCNSKGELDEFLPKIRNIYNRFVKLGYYHNDLRYKNIIIDTDTKRLYLIDFEFTSREYKDLDDENIVKNLKQRKKRTKSK
jgi:tRNA A-37 threonylcarbamoyl transferase component Bud32